MVRSQNHSGPSQFLASPSTHGFDFSILSLLVKRFGRNDGPSFSTALRSSVTEFIGCQHTSRAGQVRAGQLRAGEAVLSLTPPPRVRPQAAAFDLQGRCGRVPGLRKMNRPSPSGQLRSIDLEPVLCDGEFFSIRYPIGTDSEWERAPSKSPMPQMTLFASAARNLILSYSYKSSRRGKPLFPQLK
jgi:hypothetical protein